MAQAYTVSSGGLSQTARVRLSRQRRAPAAHGVKASGCRASALAWSLLAAGLAYLVFRRWRAGLVLGLVVFSHWVLDFIVHPPDLHLLLGSSPAVGLGLWSSGPGLVIALLLEIGLLAGGFALYWAGRRKRAARGALIPAQNQG